MAGGFPHNGDPTSQLTAQLHCRSGHALTLKNQDFQESEISSSTALLGTSIDASESFIVSSFRIRGRSKIQLSDGLHSKPTLLWHCSHRGEAKAI